MSDGAISINVKGPQDVKLSITVPAGATVAELKALVAEADSQFPPDQQRLIYSGRVLKDEELCSKYSLKDGHTIHLVGRLHGSRRSVDGGGRCRQRNRMEGRERL